MAVKRLALRLPYLPQKWLGEHLVLIAWLIVKNVIEKSIMPENYSFRDYYCSICIKE